MRDHGRSENFGRRETEIEGGKERKDRFMSPSIATDDFYRHDLQQKLGQVP